MNCDDFCRELSRWLETVWDTDAPGDPTPPVELSSHAEGCRECQNRLDSALSLIKAQSAAGKPSPFLAARINEKLRTVKPKERRRPVMYTSLAAALAVVLIAIGLLAGPFKGNRKGETELLVKFTLEAPAAEQVYVVGDWNDWNATANPLFDDNADGLWETNIKLEAGKEYRYQFYIDDSKWVADPKAPLKIDDGFGGQNSILRI